MLIYAIAKMAQPIWLFFHQKMRNWLGNYKKKKKKKKEGEKSLRVWTGGAKNEMLSSSGYPLAYARKS